MSVVVNQSLRMVVSGNALLQEPISREALELTGVDQPNVLLIGTPKATPESFAEFVVKASAYYTELGATVTNLHDYEKAPSEEEATNKIGEADMLWVAGGDTLKMVGFWLQHGLDDKIHKAANRGTVLGGGSAGMLAWFESGHSDSISYRVNEGEPWDYIFVNGLGYIAAAGCPHFDGKTGSALPRERDFIEKFTADDTLPKIGIGITNRAALAIYDGLYRVVPVPDPEKPAAVHVFTKTHHGLAHEQLPIDSDYQPIDF